ncbi:MAG TPA: hypothetical protein GX704_05515 [Clostridiales bacterium]|jgi:RNA-binding protein YlmH|nr:hypothetical protein [Clostridiales bacterium]
MEFFESRIEDLLNKSDGGEAASSDFLTPQQGVIAAGLAARSGLKFRLFGGYETAERRKLFLLPDWTEGFSDEAVDDFFKSEYEKSIIPLFLERDAYITSHPGDMGREIGHRDYLGALTGAGIDRSRVGDICVSNEGAAVFLSPEIANFLLSPDTPLKTVGREKIDVKPFAVPADFDGWRVYQPVEGVGASPRLDSVLSALTKQSREKIKAAIIRGDAEVNYIAALKPDLEIKSGDIISLRGWGKCRIKSFTDTKKDRARVSADKYV